MLGKLKIHRKKDRALVEGRKEGESRTPPVIFPPKKKPSPGMKKSKKPNLIRITDLGNSILPCAFSLSGSREFLSLYPIAGHSLFEGILLQESQRGLVGAGRRDSLPHLPGGGV